MDGKSSNATSSYNGAQASHSIARSDAPLVDVQPPRPEDLQPTYAKIVSTDDDNGENNWYKSMITGLGVIVGSLGAIPCCICCPNPYRPVSQGNVGLVTRFGRFSRAEDPGLVRVNPLSEKLIMVDVKIQICEVPQQVCMTKDNVTVHLTSVIYYHIVAPHKAAFGISNVRQALIERTQTTLRHVVGARVLQEVIERREEIAQSIGEIIEEVAAGWGVRVESMLIKDIIFTRELQDSLSMAAQQKRIGESKVIAARAEVEAAKLMRQAADILSSNAAMQIRYLEAMQQIAKTSGSKVIFLPGANNGPQALQSGAYNDQAESGPSNDGGMSDAYKAQILENM